MAGLMPLVVGGFTAGTNVALPFGSLIFFHGFLTRDIPSLVSEYVGQALWLCV